MKRITTMLLALIIVFSLAVTSFAANSTVSITINGEPVAFSDEYGYPYIDENNRTQVPLRVVMEQFGGVVTWNNTTQTAMIVKDGTTVEVPIGEKYIIVNGKRVENDTSAVIIDSRTYLPIRAVLEAFDAKVDWQSGNVVVSTPEAKSIENISVDDEGNIILEQSDGTKINLGSIASGRDGIDGKDGVSVTNALVDESGNLQITLSNGSTINAGNITGNGQVSELTFDDYPVGTKFYCMSPSGEFDVPVLAKGTQYSIHVNQAYFELTGKKTANDPEAWKLTTIPGYSDSFNSMTTYSPYEITVFCEGNTSSDLAGARIQFLYSSSRFEGTGYLSCDGVINADGTFSFSTVHQVNVVQPESMFLDRVAYKRAPTIVDSLKINGVDYKLVPNKEVSFTYGTTTYEGINFTSLYSGDIPDNATVTIIAEHRTITILGEQLKQSMIAFYENSNAIANTYSSDDDDKTYVYNSVLLVPFGPWNAVVGEYSREQINMVKEVVIS